MGSAIVKQPDGRLAIWTTYSDQFVLVNATPAEVCTYYLQEDLRRSGRLMRNEIRRVFERGTTSGYGTTFEDFREQHIQRHGSEKLDKMLASTRPAPVMYETWVSLSKTGEPLEFLHRVVGESADLDYPNPGWYERIAVYEARNPHSALIIHETIVREHEMEKPPSSASE